MEVGMGIFAGVDFCKMVECFKKIGIKRTFIEAENPDFDEIMKLFGKNDIICETLHAPFNRINDMWGDDDVAADDFVIRLKRAIDRCAQNNIPVIIVHLSSGRPMPPINEKGLRRFEEVFKYAEINNVTIALENQRYLENLDYFLKKYKNTKFCWDTGHEYGFSKGIRFMELFGKRATALHIHDNRCGDNTDDHLIPYDGNIDFSLIAKTLAESGYSGTLMLEITKNAEIDGVLPYENMSEEEYIMRAFDAVNKLKNSVLSFKSNNR